MNHNYIKILFLFLFTCIFSNLWGLDYYWVGGSGDWTDINHWATTSGGNLKHIQTPTPADNVFIDDNAGGPNTEIKLTIPAILCRTLDVSTLTYDVKFTGNCHTVRLFGGLKLSSHLIWASSISKINFEAQTPGHQIQSNNNAINIPLYFIGLNGQWSLMDSLVVNQSIFHQAGTLTTNGNAIHCSSYSSKSINARAIQWGSTRMYVNNIDIDGAGFSSIPGTSKIHLLNNTFWVQNCGNQSFYDLECYVNNTMIDNSALTLSFHNVHFRGDASVSGSANYNILELTPKHRYSFGSGSTQTFYTDLIANGSCTGYIYIGDANNIADFYKNGGTIDINWIILHNIHASGASFNAYSSVDLGGNTGWNIQSILARTLYWVGDSGIWEDSSHWALSSGGIGGECIPTLLDDVVFDNNSFSSDYIKVIISDTAGNCHDMTWTGNRKGILKDSTGQYLRISGSLYFNAPMINALDASIKFVSNQMGEQIQTANHDLLQSVEFLGSGSWTLLDSLKVNKAIGHVSGHLYTNDQYVRAQYYNATKTYAKSLHLSTSTVDIVNGGFALRQDATVVYPGTSTIRMIEHSLFKTTHYPKRNFWNLIFKDNDDNYGHFMTTHSKFHKIIYHTNIQKQGFITVDSIYYHAGSDYQLQGVDTITQYARIKGYCTKQTTLRCPIPLQHATFVKGNGSIIADRVHLLGIYGIGGANFTATNSGNMGQNFGWNFTGSGTQLYWVNGQGDWHDSLHWSYQSGGLGGACLPTYYDSVYFDVLGGLNSGDSVYVKDPNAFCRDMMWFSGLNLPIFYTKNSNLFVSGNMELSQDMYFDYNGFVNFCDTSHGKTIKSNGQTYKYYIQFIDSGGWVLADDFRIEQSILQHYGSFKTNGYTMDLNGYHAYNGNRKTFDFRNSILRFKMMNIQSSFDWQMVAGAQFLSDSSVVYMNNNSNTIHLSGVGQVDFNRVIYTKLNSGNKFTATSGVQNFNKYVEFRPSAAIYGSHTYDSLVLSAGGIYRLSAGDTQYINQHLESVGDCARRININGDGGASNIQKNTGVVDIYQTNLKNIHSQGNAVFNANGGYDNGGNVGWNFYPDPARTLYWVGGNGSWIDTTHWSLSSGGPGGECIPTKIDDVIIDSNSTASKTFNSIDLSSGGECLNLLWKHWPGVKVQGSLEIYGSINFNKKIDAANFALFFKSPNTDNLIKTANNTWASVSFDGIGGWNLYDSLMVVDSLYLNAGYLNTKNQFVKGKAFSSLTSQPKRLDLGASSMQLSMYFLMNSDSLTLYSGTSTIKFKGGGYYKFALSGPTHQAYHNVVVDNIRNGTTVFNNYNVAWVTFNKVVVPNDGIFYQKYSFDSLIFAPGNTYKFQEGMTSNINKYWEVRGNNCYAINLQSTIMNQVAYVFKDSGSVVGDFLNIRDLYAMGGNSYYAGKFSTDMGNNSGWIFQNGPNYVYGLGQDTSFALGQDVVIHTNNFNGGPLTLYNWSTGSTHDTIHANKSGWYYVTVTYAGNCEVVDSLYIGCRLHMNYQTQDVICHGDTTGMIQAIVPDSSYYYNFIWNTGDTSSLLKPYPAGAYIVKVFADSGKCNVVDTIQISEPPAIVIPQPDTAFCIPDSIQLDLGLFSKYFWSDSTNSRYKWVNTADTFYVAVEDFKSCRSAWDTIVIRQDSMPFYDLGTDTCVGINTPLHLSPGNIFDNYTWLDGTQSEDLWVYIPGIYWVEIQHGSCFRIDSINVESCPPELKLPNVFTPNGDGVNDNFVPVEQNIAVFDMKIYNRWGMRIYHTTDVQKGWDGTYNNNEAPDGVYFYVIEYREWQGASNSNILHAQGTVTLLRNTVVR